MKKFVKKFVRQLFDAMIAKGALFSMVTWDRGRTAEVAVGDVLIPSDTTGIPEIHYKKETRYTLNYGFAEHLKTCLQCRDQLVSSLRETIDKIESGQMW